MYKRSASSGAGARAARRCQSHREAVFWAISNVPDLRLDAKISRRNADKERSSHAAPDMRRMCRSVLCYEHSSHRRVLKIFDRLCAIALSLRFTIGGGHESTVSHCPMASRSSDLAKNKVSSPHLLGRKGGKGDKAANCARSQETDLAFVRKQPCS